VPVHLLGFTVTALPVRSSFTQEKIMFSLFITIVLAILVAVGIIAALSNTHTHSSVPSYWLLIGKSEGEKTLLFVMLGLLILLLVWIWAST
jgi:hypothetical protein